MYEYTFWNNIIVNLFGTKLFDIGLPPYILLISGENELDLLNGPIFSSMG